MGKKTLISWSSGKDSAWALHVLRKNPEIEILGLFCTVNKVFDRVSIHGVRRELLKQQAESVGLPLNVIELPHPCGIDEYASLMKQFIFMAKERGIECFAFGDLFLRDVRNYRESLLEGTGIIPLFPLWGVSTHELSRQMISKKLKAVITCLNPDQIPQEFSGREYNKSFLEDLPHHIDPCGENGEFHSFAYEGPMFQYPIKFIMGETIYRDGAYFTDLCSSLT